MIAHVVDSKYQMAVQMLASPAFVFDSCRREFFKGEAPILSNMIGVTKAAEIKNNLSSAAWGYLLKSAMFWAVKRKIK